ncbi:MAG: hypothetical protein HGA54_05475, partial [Actinobacteria bacterium]|nr:hypothetical protein [Actinomycetota bacterium]
ARLNKKYEVPVQIVEIPSDEESLAEGKRIFQYRGCEACHGEDLQGLVYLDNPAIGQVITPNLTSGQGGIGTQRTGEDLIRAVKHGIRPDGTPLLFIPSWFSWTLCALSLAVLVRWELNFNRHPERFSERLNLSLRCAGCQEKICRIKDPK